MGNLASPDTGSDPSGQKYFICRHIFPHFYYYFIFSVAMEVLAANKKGLFKEAIKFSKVYLKWRRFRAGPFT